MTSEEQILVNDYIRRLNSAFDKADEARAIAKEILALRRTDLSKREIASSVAHEIDPRTGKWLIKSHSNQAFLAAGQWLTQFVASQTTPTAASR